MLQSLHRSFKRAVVSLQELSGVSVISNRSRDKLLERAPWLRSHFLLSEHITEASGHLPEGAESHLRYDNPALEELRRRYAGRPAASHIQWGAKEFQEGVDIRYFRADNLYVFQSRRYSPLAFYASAAYAKLTDRLGLWNRLDEDDHFGAELFDFHGKPMSRDLLDSILEINFLDQYCGLVSAERAIKVLDIGAGYGRLAHRFGAILPPGSRYFCTDAVPESTFIADFYLRHRGMADRVEVIPLDALDGFRPDKIDLAVNIHSFPECRLEAIAWWLKRLQDLAAEHLFIVVSSGLGPTSNEGGGKRKDFLPLIEEAGFRLVRQQAKFAQSDTLQTAGLYPSDYYLFRRV